MKFKITVLSFVSIVIFNLSPAFSGEWTPVLTGVDTYFSGIWGSSRTNVFAVGYAYGDPISYHYNGSTWSEMPIGGHKVWGTSKSDVFVIGGDTISHYDGTDWSVVYRSHGLHPYLEDIWGSSSSNVYVVGTTELPIVEGWYLPIMPIILHYDGVNWSQGYIKGLPASGATGIWGSSEDDIFVVVAGPVESRIMHYDGKSWTVMKRLPNIGLYDIWGSSGTDVFAVGEGIWHYNGRQWTLMKSGGALNAVWGTSGENVYVGGNGEPTFYHYDGSTWSPMESPVPVMIESIWGSSATDIYAAGGVSTGTILHYDGTDGGIAE